MLNSIPAAGAIGVLICKVMLVRFLFPCDYFNSKKVDEAFLDRSAGLRNVGFETSTISLDALTDEKATIYPPPDDGEKLIYCGWMLTLPNYLQLVNTVNNAGADLFISPDEYLATHHLPNWYPLIRDLTPETCFLSVDDDLESELDRLNWGSFFIKDYVKSLKTSIGAIIHKPSEIATVVAEMQKFRGSIEGGICVRQVEDFIPTTERRYFVLDGEPFAALPDEEIPAIVRECAQRISSKFFSIDAIERRDGCRRIVEIGDGQVSDLVGWTAERFAALWAQ